MTKIKKKVSKKNKSSWRKHINVKDVEDFLYENANDESQIKIISNKSDQDLFIVDSEEKYQPIVSSKQKRKLNALKKLENIINKTEEKDKNENDVEKLTVKQRKIIRAIKNKQYTLRSRRNKLKKSSVKNFSKDVWNQSPADDKLQEYKGEWISKELALHHLHGTGKQLVKVHESAHHKTSRLKAFQPPHPGTSYNPSYKDYQKLIGDIVEKETEIIKRDQHLDRVTTKMFTSVPLEEHDKLKNLENMVTEDNDNNPASTEEDENLVSRNPKVNREKKKTKTVRNKEEKLKRLVKEHNSRKEKKKQIADLYRIKSILKDVTKEQIETEIKCKHRKAKEIKKKFEPKRLSKIKFEEPDIDAFMPDEMPDGLRNVQTKTKLIVDKFKDFQRRNILPVSVDVGRRKPRKVKRFVRKSHKE